MSPVLTQVKDPVRSPPFIPSLRVELGSSSALVFGDVRGGYGGLVAPRAIHTGARLGLNDLFSLFWESNESHGTEPDLVVEVRILGGGREE